MRFEGVGVGRFANLTTYPPLMVNAVLHCWWRPGDSSGTAAADAADVIPTLKQFECLSGPKTIARLTEQFFCFGFVLLNSVALRFFYDLAANKRTISFFCSPLAANSPALVCSTDADAAAMDYSHANIRLRQSSAIALLDGLTIRKEVTPRLSPVSKTSLQLRWLKNWLKTKNSSYFQIRYFFLFFPLPLPFSQIRRPTFTRLTRLVPRANRALIGK